MKRQIMVLVILGLMGTVEKGFPGSVCDHVDIDWISSQISLSSDARIVLKQEKGQLCEIILSVGGNLAPVYAGNDFILAGQLFKDHRSITKETMSTISDVIEKERQRAARESELGKEARRTFFRKNFKALEEFVSLSFKPVQTKGFLYVITDPNCSHCKDLLSGLEQAALESETEIKVIIYPILGPKSRNMAIQTICNEYSYQAYIKIQMTEPTYPCEKAEELLKKTEFFFQSAGISFLPIVVAADGSWVVELNNIREVRSYLGIESGKIEDGSGGACASDQGS